MGGSKVRIEVERAREFHVTLPNGVTRTAKYLGSQGCVTLPFGESSVHFTLVAGKSQLPDSATEPSPMGDVLPKEALPAEIDAAKLNAAVEAGFRAARDLDCGLHRHLEGPHYRRALCLRLGQAQRETLKPAGAAFGA